ncbi:hypothetical protein AQUCO_03100090v1 [Aquilegia coerulea]|uniref:Uncharacterized protein n=1 Tax=Aquilegia coerulea TaxID=218851 RepID=A0A2G5D0P3_AQUCA|nr:hypothetical protein AQUCO_03100090v1 [Aquilegia coerulea]
MFPWLAHGHISPYLELAKKFTQRNFFIYLCSTPINLLSIKNQISIKTFPSIQLVELNLPSLLDLPPHYHTTKSLPLHLQATLKTALDMAKPIFANILSNLKPDLLIYDFIQPWAPEVASQLNIPAIHFMSMEIEAKYTEYLSFILGKEILPVGVLIQEPSNDDKDSVFLEWLNTKERSSTVFVSFGSEYYMSREEIQETAQGLELSEVNFIWVIRFPEGEEVKVDDVLPQGFLERTEERGMVVEGWAPQVKILKHPSIGGFVSHCGWSSVLEGMMLGVPLIAMPMHIDQPLNARLVVELGVGMEVERDESGNGNLVGGKIAKVIKQVVTEKGVEVRKRMMELSESMRNRGDGEINLVVEKLLQLCKM